MVRPERCFNPLSRRVPAPRLQATVDALAKKMFQSALAEGPGAETGHNPDDLNYVFQSALAEGPGAELHDGGNEEGSAGFNPLSRRVPAPSRPRSSPRRSRSTCFNPLSRRVPAPSSSISTRTAATTGFNPLSRRVPAPRAAGPPAATARRGFNPLSRRVPAPSRWILWFPADPKFQSALAEGPGAERRGQGSSRLNHNSFNPLSRRVPAPRCRATAPS